VNHISITNNLTFSERLAKESKSMLLLGAPVIASQLLQMSMGFVDTIMAGHLNPTALAAVAIGAAIMNPLIVMIIGVLMAASPIIAQVFGARKLHKIGKNVRQALWLSQFLGIPVFFLLRHMEWLMGIMHVDPNLIPVTQGYLDAISWGVPAIGAYLVLRFFNEAIGATKPGMYFALLGVFFNITGNYVFMYGKLGFPALGAVGIGLSSAIVGWVMFIGILIYSATKKSYKRFHIFHNIHLPEWEYMRELLYVGVPNGISTFLEVSMFALVALFIGSLGTDAVAGHQIAINVASITFMIPLGLSTAITVRVGQAIGRNNIHAARFSGFTGIALSAGIMACMALLLFLFPHFITNIYTHSTHVQDIAVYLLQFAAIFQISDGLQVSGIGALRGLKDTRIPMFVNIIAYWAIGLTTGYYFGLIQHYGPQGFWIGLIAGLTSAALLHNSRFLYLTHRLLNKDKTVN